MKRTTDVLSESGEIIGTKDLDEAHAKGLLHRSIHVLVVNDAGEVFVRKRPVSKPIYPALWTTSVGTHVLHGTNPDDVAQSALKDFLGLSVQIQRVGETHIQDAFENEIITVYSCNANSVADLNPNESSDGTFMTAEQIQQRGSAHETTPHLLGALKVYRTSLMT